MNSSSTQHHRFFCTLNLTRLRIATSQRSPSRSKSSSTLPRLLLHQPVLLRDPRVPLLLPTEPRARVVALLPVLRHAVVGVAVVAPSVRHVPRRLSRTSTPRWRTTTSRPPLTLLPPPKQRLNHITNTNASPRLVTLQVPLLYSKSNHSWRMLALLSTCIPNGLSQVCFLLACLIRCLCAYENLSCHRRFR